MADIITTNQEHTTACSFETAQPAWVDQLLIRINDLDTKISKIDKVSEDLSYLCSRIENLQSMVGHLEKHTGNMGNAMGEIRKP